MTYQQLNDAEHQSPCPGETWILVTDLDGTLLDRSYNLEQAASAINKLVQLVPGIAEVVLASSKTTNELRPLAQRCQRPPVLVFENGAGFATSTHTGPNGRDYDYCCTTEGHSYEHIRGFLERIRLQERLDFVGFGDMSCSELAELTGLDEVSAQRAKDRRATEPITWLGSDRELQQFEVLLQSQGLTLVQGGQFYHVSSPTDKARALHTWLQQQETSHRVIACGDAPNDRELLLRADRSIVFPDSKGNYLLPQNSITTHARSHGPDGWLCAVKRVFEQPIDTQTQTEQSRQDLNQ